MSCAIQKVAVALKTIDKKFDRVAERFEILGEYAEKMDEK
jgi:DNA-binding ferritin-like protein